MMFFKSDPQKSPTPPSPTQPSPTKDSLKDYKIVKNIGEGAFGEVYLARSRDKEELSAIKSISKNFLRKQRKEHHVYQEKLILQSFDSPMIVKLFKTFQDEQKIFFVLENIPNGELSKCIRKKKTLSYIETMFVAAEVVQILEALHSKGVIHRDLKPENLMLDKDFHLKIIDFGTADVKLLPGVNEDQRQTCTQIRE